MDNQFVLEIKSKLTLGKYIQQKSKILCGEYGIYGCEILSILHLSLWIATGKKILNQFIFNMFSTKNKIMHTFG